MSKPIRLIAVLLICAVLLPATGSPFLSASAAPLATAPTLGTAESFAVLGWLDGDQYRPDRRHRRSGCLPRSPRSLAFLRGSSILQERSTPVMRSRSRLRADVTTAYNALQARRAMSTLTGQDLGGLTLTPGVYCFDSSAQLTGTLTLDAQGDPNAVWVFQIGSTLTTATNSSVVLINGGSSLQRVLAGRQLRDSRYRHCVRRKYSRARRASP